MFDFLKQFDERLFERYLTVERNIKAASNSFYDAYLDLQEQFIKFVIARFGMDASVRETSGALLKRGDIVAVFKEQLHIDDYTFNKMQDYTLKVNAHKHKGEKCIHVETIVSYMRVIYNATAAYCSYKGIEYDEFDGNYFINLFGVFEKENIELKAQANSLKEELAASVEQHKLKERDIEEYRNIISQAQLEKMSLEEQNVELQKMISKLKDIYHNKNMNSVLSADDFYSEIVADDLKGTYLPKKFESISKEFLIRAGRAHKISPLIYEVGTYVFDDARKKINRQFDVVTLDKNGYISYECKYTDKPVGSSVINEEEYQRVSAGIAFYKLGFISKNGFTEDVSGEKYNLFSLKDFYSFD